MSIGVPDYLAWNQFVRSAPVTNSSGPEGSLYIAASRPESKRWPGWVEDEPNIKLKLGDRLFEGRLQRLNSADEISPVSEAYDVKYQLTQSLTLSEEGPSSWFWRVVAR